MESTKQVGQHLILRTDGAARGNPGPAAAGAVIQSATGETLATEQKFLGRMTNNQAEYEGLILGLNAITSFAPTAVTVKMDSELVVKQMRGEYRVKAVDLMPLYQTARTLALALGKVTFTHVPRAENRLADHLCNQTLDNHR